MSEVSINADEYIMCVSFLVYLLSHSKKVFFNNRTCEFQKELLDRKYLYFFSKSGVEIFGDVRYHGYVKIACSDLIRLYCDIDDR